MSRCNFCQREFKNTQAVKAHLRTCPNYPKSKHRTAMPVQPLGPSPSSSGSLHQDSLAPTEPGKTSNPFVSFVEQTTNQFAGPDEATQRRQKREALLTGLCSDIVDRYRPVEGVVSQEMSATVKIGLLDELGILPIEDLSPTERSLRAEAIRNRVLAPYLRAQKEQLAQQKEQLEHETELRRQEILQIKEEAAMQTRRATRKATLMEIGAARALKTFASLHIAHGHRALFEWEVRKRLDILLEGDETEGQAEEAIEAAIQGPLAEWDERLERARLAKRRRVVNQCVPLVVPLVQAALPWVTTTVINKFREKFGVPPASQSTAPPKKADVSSEKPSPPSSPNVSTSDPVRTQPEPSVDPIVEQDESVIPSKSELPESQESQRAAS